MIPSFASVNYNIMFLLYFFTTQITREPILWRKLKYEWMPFSAYESLATLKKELFNILKNIGEEYVIAYT